MARTYQRSQILYFHELTPAQQAIAIGNGEISEDETFVLWNNEPISLDMFMRTNGGLFHGYYGISAFDGYLIRINKTQEFATVVHATF